jgi:flagellar secretion chaperone FliS
MMNQALAYDETNHMSSMDPLQTTILAYDGVIKDLRQAKNHYLGQSEDEAIQRNQHAQDLITELLLGLDYERGGEIARNLSKLYDFALRQLVGMGAGSDVLMYDHLINIFGDLRETWVQIDAQRC